MDIRVREKFFEKKKWGLKIFFLGSFFSICFFFFICKCYFVFVNRNSNVIFL